MPISGGTGGCKRLVWKILGILELDKYFDILVSVEDITKPKRDHETFLKCAQKMNVEHLVCQVYEDGKTRIKVAVAAVMMYTLVTDYYCVTIWKEI